MGRTVSMLAIGFTSVGLFGVFDEKYTPLPASRDLP